MKKENLPWLSKAFVVFLYLGIATSVVLFVGFVCFVGYYINSLF